MKESALPELPRRMVWTRLDIRIIEVKDVL